MATSKNLWYCFTLLGNILEGGQIPKFGVCLLRAALGKLPTKARLRRCGIDVELRCVLCEGGVEEGDHLFFSCEFAQYLWALCKLRLGVRPMVETLLEECRFISRHFKRKRRISSLARILLGAVVWHTWRERNARIFQGVKKDKWLVFQEICAEIRLAIVKVSWKEVTAREADIMERWGL